MLLRIIRVQIIPIPISLKISLLDPTEKTKINIDRRKNIKILKYNKKLINNKIICVPYQKIGNYHVYNQFTLRVKRRKRFTSYLEKHSIPYGIYYPTPIYKQKAFDEYNYKCNLMNTEKITKECISIPMYPELDNNTIEYISEIINKYK